MQKLLSWFDVRRVVSEKTQLGSQLPKEITCIECLPSALKIGIDNKNPRAEKVAAATLKDWFGERFDGMVISLEIGEKLPVEFVDNQDSHHDVFIRPLWEERVYAKSTQQRDIDPNLPKIVAFHSFSGGVGKTIHLAAHLLALLEHADESETPVSILLIDADLSSPRITYWNDYKETVSLISFLECYQSNNRDDVLNFFSEKLKKHEKKWGDNKVYVLPAFSSEQQLLDKNVLPEHLTRNDATGWGYTDSIQALAKAVNADYVFMNLESGLSTGAAPILFDNSIHRFLVTSPEISSLRGTEIILRYLGRANPSLLGITPRVIFNQMKAELDDQLTEDNIERLKKAYCNTDSSRLIVETTDYFNHRRDARLDRPGDGYSHLAVVNRWSDAIVRLTDTSIKENARKWVNSLFNQ